MAKSISNYEKDWNAALDFTYTEHDVTKDASGRPKTTEVSQVSVLDGTPYSRLIGKNGHPLSHGRSPQRERKVPEDAWRRAKRKRREQRARRLRKYQEERRFLHEIPDAFDMKLLGHETVGGRGQLPRRTDAQSQAMSPNRRTPGSFRISRASSGSMNRICAGRRPKPM